VVEIEDTELTLGEISGGSIGDGPGERTGDADGKDTMDAEVRPLAQVGGESSMNRGSITCFTSRFTETPSRLTETGGFVEMGCLAGVEGFAGEDGFTDVVRDAGLTETTRVAAGLSLMEAERGGAGGGVGARSSMLLSALLLSSSTSKSSWVCCLQQYALHRCLASSFVKKIRTSSGLQCWSASVLVQSAYVGHQ
jgi:cobalamin synthase